MNKAKEIERARGEGGWIRTRDTNPMTHRRDQCNGYRHASPYDSDLRWIHVQFLLTVDMILTYDGYIFDLVWISF